jgi:hypothetical protein
MKMHVGRFLTYNCLSSTPGQNEKGKGALNAPFSVDFSEFCLYLSFMKIKWLQKKYLYALLYLIPVIYIIAWIHFKGILYFDSFSLQAKFIRSFFNTSMIFFISLFMSLYFVKFKPKKFITLFRILLMFNFIVCMLIFLLFFFLKLSYLKYFPLTCVLAGILLHAMIVKDPHGDY